MEDTNLYNLNFGHEVIGEELESFAECKALAQIWIDSPENEGRTNETLIITDLYSKEELHEFEIYRDTQGGWSEDFPAVL